MRLPRMTTRRWMVAVAVVVVLMVRIAYAVQLTQLAAYHRRRAAHLCPAEQRFGRPGCRDEVPDHAAAERLGRLADRYEYAASFPWLLVEPDPPGATAR